MQRKRGRGIVVVVAGVSVATEIGIEELLKPRSDTEELCVRKLVVTFLESLGHLLCLNKSDGVCNTGSGFSSSSFHLLLFLRLNVFFLFHQSVMVDNFGCVILSPSSSDSVAIIFIVIMFYLSYCTLGKPSWVVTKLLCCTLSIVYCSSGTFDRNVNSITMGARAYEMSVGGFSLGVVSESTFSYEHLLFVFGEIKIDCGEMGSISECAIYLVPYGIDGSCGNENPPQKKGIVNILLMGLSSIVYIDICNLPYLSTVIETYEKCENFLLKGWFIKFLITDFKAYLKHFSKILKTDNMFLVIHLESNRTVMNGCGGLELLHIDLRNIS
ncbi:hypothetical protein Tco_0770072 [Tanacetum coccineum]|uniref:Uncharacterized protein n=1 Tax=Tanacetum coccineum TaxID=301880 RepID=A0ABQ4ZDR6_9ASTR